MAGGARKMSVCFLKRGAGLTEGESRLSRLVFTPWEVPSLVDNKSNIMPII